MKEKDLQGVEHLIYTSWLIIHLLKLFLIKLGSIAHVNGLRLRRSIGHGTVELNGPGGPCLRPGPT